MLLDFTARTKYYLLFILFAYIHILSSPQQCIPLLTLSIQSNRYSSASLKSRKKVLRTQPKYLMRHLMIYKIKASIRVIADDHIIFKLYTFRLHRSFRRVISWYLNFRELFLLCEYSKKKLLQQLVTKSRPKSSFGQLIFSSSTDIKILKSL